MTANIGILCDFSDLNFGNPNDDFAKILLLVYHVFTLKHNKFFSMAVTFTIRIIFATRFLKSI